MSKRWLLGEKVTWTVGLGVALMVAGALLMLREWGVARARVHVVGRPPTCQDVVRQEFAQDRLEE